MSKQEYELITGTEDRRNKKEDTEVEGLETQS